MTRHERSTRFRIRKALRDFLAQEAAGGIVLMAVAVLALIVANSALAPHYFAALGTYLGPLNLIHWINDGLMAVFFLLVGLEIKRELVVGQLSSWPRRALPGIAALGGMLVPALIYVVLNTGSPATLRGWAIPAATDIAFALGVLSLLGSRVPNSLRIFLAALAILDDLGAVAIIAVFYTSELSLPALGVSAVLLIVLAAMNRLGVVRLWPYLLVGLVLWVAVLRSGVHATLAGVALALFVPLQNDGSEGTEHSPLERLEHALHPYVAFLVVPIFGFANAGVPLAGVSLATLLSPVPLGIAAGLFVGKQIGVVLFSLAAVRLRLAALPDHASFTQLYGVGVLCGIGFTMSLFIGLLAFPSPELQDAVKIGVLAGSVTSMVLGAIILIVAGRRR